MHKKPDFNDDVASFVCDHNHILLNAIIYGNNNLAKKIIREDKKGELINKPDNYKYAKNTPFVLAAKTGNIEIMLELLKHPKFSPKSGYDYKNRNALFWAVAMRYNNIIELLIKKGGCIYSTNKSAKSILDPRKSTDITNPYYYTEQVSRALVSIVDRISIWKNFNLANLYKRNLLDGSDWIGEKTKNMYETKWFSVEDPINALSEFLFENDILLDLVFHLKLLHKNLKIKSKYTLGKNKNSWGRKQTFINYKLYWESLLKWRDQQKMDEKINNILKKGSLNPPPVTKELVH